MLIRDGASQWEASFRLERGLGGIFTRVVNCGFCQRIHGGGARGGWGGGGIQCIEGRFGMGKRLEVCGVCMNGGGGEGGGEPTSTRE